ncbi:MAG: NUDIX domain-containing protein [Spirochaetaceae bacterium]|jgi:8-oxo-dGTP diphosphatase|nr:NUDIX domain-containing protein [Spirochaetaceae bacterium]
MLKSIAGIAAEEGGFFIARRKGGGDLGGKWEFPGGKVEEGESDTDALIREYREELGVSIKTGPLLGTVTFEHRGETRVLNAYRVYLSDHHFTLSEHTEWRWAGFKEIETLDFADSDLRLLPWLRRYFQ